MEYYAGIDVSLKGSSVCVVDATGKVVREVKVTSESEAVLRYFDELDTRKNRWSFGVDGDSLIESDHGEPWWIRSPCSV